jgi:L-seryl-tRNA(Ser) seleniumtransferase
MAESGARVVEVGTTNRTHLADYVRALEDGDGGGRTALILRAHRSNFRLVGFSSEPTLAALVDIAEAHGVVVMDDLGSGALLDTSDFGLAHEPMVQESLEAGAHLVCFSGDKLLGGPQAGIIVGRASVVEPLKRHPLARALRADKLCLVALQRTLLHYLRGEAAAEVPVWRMIAQDQDQIAARATDWQRSWREAGLTATLLGGRSAVGGGSLPGETLPTTLVALETPNADAAAAALRAGAPPVVARIEEGRLVLDPRSVLEEQEPKLLKAVAVALMGDRENR